MTEKQSNQRSVMITLGSWLLPLAAIFLLWLPGQMFFSLRGGASFLSGADAKTWSKLMFPLFGLYAFTLLWMQLMIGSLMPHLRRIYTGIERYHRWQGIFVLLFATTHPALLFVGVGIQSYLRRDFVAPENVKYIWLGYTALALLYMTVGAALLRKLVSVKRWWRRVHVLNYLVFALVWLHSWNIGSDVQGTNLRWLWLVFGVSAIVATFLRLTGARQRAERVVEPSIPQPVTEPPVPIHQTSAASSEAGFVRVAALDQLADGKPFCATVNGKQLALFRLGNEVFALDNRCNHAAGPLCEGFVEGSVVECPLHGSRFNVQTGAVLRGPALDPQPVYQVRVQGQSVEVKT